MGISQFFGIGLSSGSDQELLSHEIFPLGIKLTEFVELDVMNVYSRILTDCLERTQGIPEQIQPLLWDNYLQGESRYGLITLLSKAMTDQRDLFIVYNPAVGVIREANQDEASRIRDDYKKLGESAVGTYLSFKNFCRTEMVKLYSGMEYCVISSLNKMANLSKAIQFKMSEMRSSVNLTDSTVAVSQAKAIARSLANGRDVLMDKNDVIETAIPNVSTVKESIAFLDSKRSFYYSMPLSYINGEQTTGIGTTGEADAKAVERGLKAYYISILKPAVEAIFEVKTSFKSMDFRQIASALEAVKTFELVSDDFISKENKQLIVSKLFDVELDGQ